MVTAYSSFVGHGQRSTPIYVTSICDNSGIEIDHFDPILKEVFSFDSYLKMLPILRDVVDRGTGGRIRSRYKIKAPMGGKTGTTNDNSDGWFMSFTPSLVAGCWVGGEERSICFDRMTYGQGASMALPIAAMFWQNVFADSSLPYNVEEHFFYPEDYDPCSGQTYVYDDISVQDETESGFFN